MTIEFNRRQFLGMLLAAGAAPRALAATQLSDEFWVSAQGAEPKNYSVTAFDKMKAATEGALTGFRGHGLAQHPRRRDAVVMFARRPGYQGAEFNLKTGEITQRFHVEHAQRTMSGHGCFSRDGRYLYTAEADIVSGKGKIAIRDGGDYRKLGEMESHGLGPHEIKLMPDGKTLVVANTGIITRPKTGRKTLNLDTMDPNLVYLDAASGKLLEEHRVAEKKASIRHLDVAKDGTVAIAMQVQRDGMIDDRLVALAATHKRGEDIRLLDKPAVVIRQMHDYMESIVINNRSRMIGTTSPRGNVAVFWHLDSGKFAGYHRLHDVSGMTVTQDQEHFVISNSTGQLRFLNAFTLSEKRDARKVLPSMEWDNHMITAVI